MSTVVDHTVSEEGPVTSVSYYGYDWSDLGTFGADGTIQDPSVIMDIENWSVSYDAVANWAADGGIDTGLLADHTYSDLERTIF